MTDDDFPPWSMTVRLQLQSCATCQAPGRIINGQPQEPYTIVGRGFTPHTEQCPTYLAIVEARNG
jgi:hypothetical protein